MTAPTQLEERLRTGLRAAAEAVPPAPDTIPVPDEQVVRLRSVGLAPGAGPRRRRAMVALATAAALAALAGTAVVLTGDSGEADSSADIAAESEEPTTTTTEPYTPRQANGMVPGRAVGGDGVLHLFGPDGRPSGTLDVAPLGYVHSATSDLDGGWVVCGTVYKTFEELNAGLAPEERAELEDAADEAWVALDEAQVEAGAATAEATEPSAPPTTVPVLEGEPVPPGEPGDTGETTPTIEADVQELEGANVDVLTWFPAGREPIELDGNVGFPGCMDSTVQVVDSPDGPVLLKGGVSFGEDGGDMHPRLDGVVLATGERREYRVPPLSGLPMQWSVTTGKALIYIDGVGLQLFDLATNEQVPTAAIDPGDASDLALSHDGRTAAVLRGPVMGPVEAIVYDLATGAEIYRRSFDMSSEGDQMSYDGTTLAVGNFYDGYGPMTVIDVATGAEHSVDAHGFVL